ncbi:Predicted metal-binding integral membrane protein [Variovorax sp. HW608]|uniref:copper chaperone n=1 Tax=Variovorax sp. HW608 TaxID=1034889 RepID=UPI00081FE713|nr:DUF2182 domain-containing protein [Variovorax sp. HW608]SCK21960.1 Predicted metal-binding integral membrane protein [Variovorax sp. HW608]
MDAWIALCISASGDEWQRGERTLRAAWQTGVLREAFIHWLLMALVMMPVLSLPLIRFVAVRSFTQRRALAVTEFLCGLWAVWMMAGVALVPLAVLWAVFLPVHEFAAPLAFGFAALWQITPIKRSALERCHRTVALSAAGWRADRDCLAFGLRSARQCVVSCWPMMFACALAAHSIPALAIVLTIAMRERAAHAPQPTRYAFLLAGFALVLTLHAAGAP